MNNRIHQALHIVAATNEMTNDNTVRQITVLAAKEGIPNKKLKCTDVNVSGRSVYTQDVIPMRRHYATMWLSE
eukprot:3311442-Amphidinium_carterae.1